jgi:hypothetical protein
MAGFLGNTPAEKYISLEVQHFTTSATSSYVLSNSVTNENEVALYLNNVRQQPGSSYAYTCSGTALSLSSATSGTDTLYCVYLGRSIGTINPPTGSVGASQLTTNAVSNSAMADDAVGIAELSATGTASSSNFLRGDNSWATPAVGIAELSATGTPSSTTFLAGNNTWSAPAGGADTSLSNLSASGSNRVALAWANFDPYNSPFSIQDSYNISSITDNSAGKFTINFATSLGNANYVMAGSAPFWASTQNYTLLCGQWDIAQSTTSAEVMVQGGSGSFTDMPRTQVVIFGDA